jgi:phosphoglycolate phosphatase-like HAD superfamily hydrolase
MHGIFFGDAASDYEAAKKYAFDFIFVSYNSDWKNISEMPNFNNLTNIHSFQDLKLFIS